MNDLALNNLSLIKAAEKNLNDILNFSFQVSMSHETLVLFDLRCELSKILTEAYRHCLPQANFIDFDSVTGEIALEELSHLKSGDFVIMIQSSNFRLDAFRIRVELFKRGLKVLEHTQLARIMGPQEVSYYVDSLSYDPNYYRGTGKALKDLLDKAQNGVIESGGEKLVFGSAFEDAKLNVGDYSEMKNIGGQFPIGEVFTEAKVLEAVNGNVRIFAFGDTSFKVNIPTDPITLKISKGQVAGVENSTPEFDQVLDLIRASEEVVWVRELGFGLNRAFSTDRIVSDIGTYERMCGVHLSLGAKHTIYGKPNLKKREGRYHIDIFAVTESVRLDDVEVFRGGSWLV